MEDHNLYANFRQRILPGRVVFVKRTLPGKVKIDVVKNQEVIPYDVLGSSSINSGFSSINLAQKLHVSISDALKYLERPIGQVIFKGELLASKKGFFGKTNLLAPTDGILESYNNQTGELRLKFIPRQKPLVAGVYGIIEGINNETGEVLIKTLVTEIRGIYGTGNERGGFLNILSSRGDLASESQIKPEMGGHILVSGALIYGEALRLAAGHGIAGIISGGFNVGDVRSIAGSIYPEKQNTQASISIIGTEGFGLIPIGDDIFSLINAYNGKFVFIDGKMRRVWLPSLSPDSILTLRKISLPQDKPIQSLPELNTGTIRIGLKARIIWPPFMGAQGKIEAIDKSVTVLESGISTYLLTIETPSRKIKVPYTNIEIID